MAGRRLLDLAKLVDASRNVAKQHLELRAKQLDVYNKTSTLAKAVKHQTDRVTLTAQAATALAKRLNEEAPRYAENLEPQDLRDRSESTAGDKTATAKNEADTVKREALECDNYVKRSDHNARSEVVQKELGASMGQPTTGRDTYTQRPQPEPVMRPLEQQQSQSEQIKPVETHTSAVPTPSTMRYSPQRARDLQRQAEFQIPAATTVASSPRGTDHDRDVYHDRPKTANTTYSSLPRAKIPRHTEGAQPKSLNGDAINADVFHVRPNIAADGAGTVTEAPPKGIDLNVFRTSRVSDMLGFQKPRKEVSTTEFGRPQQQVKDGIHPALRDSRDSSHVPDMTPDFPTATERIMSANNRKGSTDDTRRLTEGMPKDTEQQVMPEAENSADLTSSRQDVPAPFQMRESRVPSSRLGRLWQYAGLGTSMALGAMSESLRRATGGGVGGSLILGPANMERLVTKLSRMRGAALKLGQMISFQDLKLLPPPIYEVLQRVQDSADYMPVSQRNRVLAADLGSDWHELFNQFDEVPIAAASIGQVHRAILKKTGEKVAVKVQYPGVAQSIDSDLNNLSILLTASRLLPKGLYLEKTIANARIELGWECDYLREAKMAERFRTLLANETNVFTVPRIIPEASGKQVLTAELMHGTAVTKPSLNLTQDERDWIGTQILRLCLREITEFKFMQTDPNWTNFLYNRGTKKLELLDFGASRTYPDEFVDPYVEILRAASRGDKTTIRDLSIRLGYLTGGENKAMRNAHVDSVLTLAEPFAKSAPEVYDFSDQTITDRVRALIPLMMRERLSPPPEETYSLHRKLSGAFLLCARLGSNVRCRDMFEIAMANWEKKAHSQ